MQLVRLVRRTVYISVLGEKAVLRRNAFTMEGPGKGKIVPCIAVGDGEQDEKLLQPVAHILQVPGKQLRPKLFSAFNYWLKVPAAKLNLVSDIVEKFHTSNMLTVDIMDNSIFRRGIPAAHTIYGFSSTFNAASYIFLISLKKAQGLNHPEVMTLCKKWLSEACQGQGMDVYWCDNYTCPTIKEYQDMAKRKTGALFSLGIQLMQLFCENKADFTKLTDIFGLYYQIWNDYHNLCCQEDKGYCEDLTKGKFSFPIIHAITSHPHDSQVIHILRQRTCKVELKKHCVMLLEKFGSLSYTRHTLEELDAEARAEMAKHGGNPMLEDLLDELLNWKRWTDVSKSVQ